MKRQGSGPRPLPFQFQANLVSCLKVFGSRRTGGGEDLGLAKTPRKDSFLQGAMILTIASLAVRLIGVAQRIPLYRLLGAEGSGIFAYPYPIYAVMLAVSSTGINIAISKLIAERVALGDASGARRVFRLSLGLMVGLGLVLGVVLFLLSGTLSRGVNHDERAALSYMALAPAVLFAGVVSAYRGHFQGLQQMTPNANSQVIEQLVRVVTMLALAYWLLPRGLDWAAAGASFGAVTGAAGSWVYLLWAHWRHRREDPEDFRATGPAVSDLPRASALLGRIIRLAIPVTLAGLGLPIIQLVDSTVVPAQLQGIGLSVNRATSEFGRLANVAFPLVNLPTVLTVALFVALVPAVAESAVLGERERIRNRSRAALRLTFLFSLPAMVGLYILPGPISEFIYSDWGAGPVVAALTTGMLFLTVQQTTSGILQGLGRVTLPVLNMGIGVAVKTILTLIWTAQPQFGINGAAYATAVGFGVAAVLNLVSVTRLVGKIVQVGDMLVRPGLASAGMAFAAGAAYNYVMALYPSNGLATVVAICLGALVYGLLLALLGGLRRADLEILPRVGPRLADLLQSFNLVRR